MLSIDVIGFLINQKSLIVLLERMQRVDDKLLKENIEINYTNTRRLTYILVALITVFEFSLVTYNFVLFQDGQFQSIWWFVTCIPLFFSSISKVWYIVLVFNVKQKFEAINNHFENTAAFFEELRKKNTKAKQKLSDLEDDSKSVLHDSIEHGGYLQREIYAKPLFKRNRVQPGSVISVSAKSNNDIVQVLPINGNKWQNIENLTVSYNDRVIILR